MSVDSLKDFLNVQGLLSAMIVGVVSSIGMSFDHDELKEASERLALCYFGWDEDPLHAANLLRRNVLWSSVLLFMVVMLYM